MTLQPVLAASSALIVVLAVADALWTHRQFRHFGRTIELNPLVRRCGIGVGVLGVTAVLLGVIWWLQSIILAALVIAVRIPLAVAQFRVWRRSWL